MAPGEIDIPENILAFRTITSILAQLPRTKPFEAIDNLKAQKWDPAERQEVKISDAFAHLAVAQHDVAALATSRCSLDVTNLRIVACTNNLPVDESLLTSKPPGSLLAKVFDFILTRNSLRDDVETSSGTPHPTIILPSELDDLKGGNVFAYMLDLEQCW